MRKLPLLIFAIFFSAIANAQKGRIVRDLSLNNWKLWLDTAASWQTDELFVSPIDVKKLPVNLPTGGWPALDKAVGKTAHLPATVEEYYWGKNGNAFGLAGNYLGVSWFSTSFTVPANQKGKRLTLQFEAVRFRAEIFINKKLVGYDLVNSTPFEIDISDHVKYGISNDIAVRITDPNGNFDWRDSQNFMWGNYRTNPTHGFGGITGKVKLVSTDKIYMSDVFIKNKPRVNEVDVEITTNNLSQKEVNGTLSLQVQEKNTNRVVYQRSYPVTKVPVGNSTSTFTITVNEAKLWSVDSPHLYILHTQWIGADKTTDNFIRRFGFRWFEIRDVAGDKQFYLNGKRIVLLTAISWGFWPVNGITPSDALARKQIEAAKKLGLNMLNFHRTIGQQNVLDYADELGLLYYAEPGEINILRTGFTPPIL